MDYYCSYEHTHAQGPIKLGYPSLHFSHSLTHPTFEGVSVSDHGHSNQP